MSNPLVADVVDSTSSTSGLSLVESVNSTSTAIQNGDWLEAGLGTADLVMTALDPFAAIISNGVGWLLEHVGPLSDALDSLAGNPDEIRSHAETWTNVAGEVNSVSTELGNLIKSDITTWTGAAADAYRERAADTANLILAAGNAAQGAADGIQLAGEVVTAVRDAVRDIIADVVGSMVSWALQVLFTLGIGLIWVVPKVVAKVAQTAAKIAQLITKLTSSMSRLTPLLKKLGDDFASAGNGLKAIKTSDNHHARSLDAPPTINPSASRGGGDSGPAVTPDATGGPTNRGGGASGVSPNSTTPDTSRGAPDINTSGSVNQPRSAPGSTMPGLGGNNTPAAPAPAPGPWGANPPTIEGKPSLGFGMWNSKFSADKVTQHTIKDQHGRPLGVGFPSQKQDVKADTIWGAKPNQAWKFKYFQAPHDPKNPNATERPAPWAINSPLGSTPFPVLAHGSKNKFIVEAAIGPGGAKMDVELSGSEYHKLLSSHQTYKNAMNGNENPLLLVSCDTGAGKAGKDFADALGKSSDSKHDVYAPTTTAWTSATANTPDGTSSRPPATADLKVDAESSSSPGRFVRYPHQ
ncbi:uncharacterized protein YukE [Actinoalloteichus hoggarensis]|uniref:Putative T7SS secretion signal domain-containing protein n=1 Tax=Actinoalloteichus hoggarensis TaxID=1470176 RepID=A0A221W959_9PSEU|nr:WXG100 family type VII secretion target [Actinoalloteichus hoggarensis]ASO22166.1 hypothetical protein AHOG_22765 [Actinoalloteichus hoggarensis]MBB5923751.1 uncharacterized protein YukE [Actinoalloteichus hoggarensis]